MALSTDLVSYYKFDENAGNTTIVDARGNQNGGASTNTSNLYDANGKINSCFNLTYTNSEYLTFAHDFFSATAQTYALWIKPNQTGTDSIMRSEYILDSDAHKTIMSVAGTDATYRFQVIAGNLTHVIDIPKADSDFPNWYKADQWVFIVLSMTSGNNNLWCFSASGNGSYNSSTAWTAESSTGLQIGRSATGVQYFDGEMDEFGIWSRAITFSEAEELYNSDNGKTYPFGEEPEPLKIFDLRFG